jgi:hypothetical protein
VIRRRATSLAWSIWATSVVITVTGVVLLVASRSAPVHPTWGVRGFELVFPITLPAVGLLVAQRRPENVIGWLFSAAGLLSAFQFASEQYAIFALLTHGTAHLTGGAVSAWVDGWLWVPILMLIGVYALLLFPTGRPPSPVWRVLGVIAPVVTAVTALGLSLSPGPLATIGSIRNPFGVAAVRDLGPAVFAPFFGLVTVAAVSIVVRFRRATGIERQQLKWIVFAACIFAVTLPLSAPPPKPGHVNYWSLLVVLSLAGVPVAAGLAVVRYRLYDIDHLITRTVTYALVTIVLGAAYTLVALVPTLIVGSSHAPSGLVAAGTLIAAALFRPVRHRAQVFVDRRFNRARYDATQTVGAFAAKLREQTDIEGVGAELQATVAETVQPSHISLWLTSASSPS